MKTVERLKQVSGSFVQGEIDAITGHTDNALMEHDVKRISDSINTDLIQPVIDYVTECDNVLLDSIQLLETDVDQNKTDVEMALKESRRANSRLDSMDGGVSLDSQTWNWMPRLFDTVQIVSSSATVADPLRHPTITWRPLRQNTESGRYILEGTLSMYVKIDLTQWGGGTVPTDERGVKRWYGWITLSGTGSDVMNPHAATITASTAGAMDHSNTSNEHVRYAAVNLGRSNNQQVHVSIVANYNDFDPSQQPVFASIELKFLRDSGGDFGFGNLYPALNPT